MYYRDAKYDRVALLCAAASFYTRKVNSCLAWLLLMLLGQINAATLHVCAAHVSALTWLSSRQGRLEREKTRRDGCFEKANHFFLEARLPPHHSAAQHTCSETSRFDLGLTNHTRTTRQANKVDGTEQLPYLARAHLALARNNIDEASKSFQSASERRDNGAESVAPILGAACCAFHRGLFHDALKLYGRALRRQPDGPPAARLGLAATLLRLGFAARARAAFERAATLDPTSAEAHLGIALCAAAHEPVDVARALSALRAAYDASPLLSPVLLLLSEHAALCAQSATGEALARAAAESAEASQLRGAACLQLGRLAHTAGRATDAAKQYSAALAVSPGDVTPHLGLGQVALARDELHSATVHLERVAATATGDACTRRALGHLYASSTDAERRLRAVELLRTAAADDPRDAGVCVELAELTRRGALPEALAEYDNALAAQRACGQPPAPALLNNAGVLAAAVGEQSGQSAARAHYAAALEACGASWVVHIGESASAAQGNAHAPLTGQAAVVTFNLACLEDDCGNTNAAASLFLLLQHDCPREVDVLLHHALSALSHGGIAATEEMASVAHANAPRNPDAVAMLGGLAIARRDFKSAQVLLDSFRKGVTGAGSRPGAQAFAYDEYIMVCAANALLADARRDSGPRGARADASSDAEAVARRDNRLERALALYSKALARAPGNMYAANGVGAILAERGRLHEAATVFMSVAEAAVSDDALSGLAHASLVNYAHCQVGLGAPGRAVRMYDQALRKSGRGATDASVLLCTARALHDWKGEGENHLRTARSALLRALHLTPADHRARFDVAFVCQEQAVRLLARFREQAPGSASRLALADAACDELHLAGRFFQQLLSLGDAHTHGLFDSKRTHVHAAFCADALAKATNARAQATREHEASQARRAAQEVERAAAEEHLRRVAEARTAADALSLQKLEAQAEAAKDRLDQAKQRWAGEASADAPEKRRAATASKSKDDEQRQESDVPSSPDVSAPDDGDGGDDDILRANDAGDVASAGVTDAPDHADAHVDDHKTAREEGIASGGGGGKAADGAHRAPRRLKRAGGASDEPAPLAKRPYTELDLEDAEEGEEDDAAEHGAKRRVMAVDDD
jgi:RNA polymerase-associated protein CTR9